MIKQVVTRDMVTAYCTQRADPRGDHHMLATWREASAQPDKASAIYRFLAGPVTS